MKFPSITRLSIAIKKTVKYLSCQVSVLFYPRTSLKIIKFHCQRYRLSNQHDTLSYKIAVLSRHERCCASNRLLWEEKRIITAQELHTRKRNCGAALVRVLQDNLILSTELIKMWIGHRKKIRKLTFRALAFKLICCHEGLMLETSAFKSLYSGQFTISTQLIKPTKFSSTQRSYAVSDYY